MKVIEHVPHGWFYLTDENAGYLDVNCETRGPGGSAGMSLLLRLTPHEHAEYQSSGSAFLKKLAAQVGESPRAYFERDVSTTHGPAVDEAIRTWKSEMRGSRASALRAPPDR